MRFPLRGAAIAAFLFLSTQLYGQSASFYPLEMLRPGQKGYGKTVFQGTTIERFEFEVLGVLKNVGPRQDMILARLYSERLTQSGVFAGMSGSPVYIDDRLVGAVAYAFPFAKEAIAGITPIQQIVDIFKEMPKRSPDVVAHLSPRTLLEKPVLASSGLPHLESMAGISADVPGLETRGQLMQIATPLTLSGFSPEAIYQFTPQLRALGLEPVRGLGGQAAAGDMKDTPLEAGSSVAVQLVRGDMDVSASGTVTHVSGNRIYAFGHPFLSIGYTDLPMSNAPVLTIISSLMNSMKIATTAAAMGTIRQDRATGIMGLTGEYAKMIPVKLKLRTSRNEVREYSYEVVNDTFLTPFLMTFTVQNGIVSSERAIGGQTLRIKCSIAIKGQPEVIFENSVSDMASSSVIAALAASAPVQFLLTSGFDNLVFEKIDIEVNAVEQTQEAKIEKIWQDKLEARPGEEVKLSVFLRKPNGETLVEKYPIRIPDIGPGILKILVGDGQTIEKSDVESELDEFIPANLGQLVRAINNLKKNDRLYIRLYRDQSGAVIEGEALPDLPPSLLALYRSEKTSGDVKSINKVIYMEHELPPTEFVLSGQKVIRVRVKS